MRYSPVADSIRDFHSFIVPSSNPKAHFDNVPCKAFRDVTGFIKRISDESLVISSKSLYILEYGSVVWYSYTTGACCRIRFERIHREFLAFVTCKIVSVHSNSKLNLIAVYICSMIYTSSTNRSLIKSTPTILYYI